MRVKVPLCAPQGAQLGRKVHWQSQSRQKGFAQAEFALEAELGTVTVTSKIAPETHRSEEVPLNERICLQVGSQCSTNESEQPSILVEKCISPPEGNN
ncbi:Interleukin-13 receptor subunit alpha-1 [Camelus dromedarius]|uniref:Interleukin-13 receptor subunit alpha-1 n=1 Tax=Camelus dromedarius TaxID=9838 RepID=A0A5N4C4C2_CAMDR|nr:Interleukin-13 receptor subunit alpha-1 [Camelus dromedarius]